MKAKSMFLSKELPETKQLINLYVEKVSVGFEDIKVTVNMLKFLSLTDKHPVGINSSSFIKEYTVSRKALNSGIVFKKSEQ